MQRSEFNKKLSNVTGLNTDVIEKIQNDVLRNNKLLNSCEMHEFSIHIPDENKLQKKYECSSCGGKVDGMKKMWYEKGIEHYYNKINKGVKISKK